ncbi:MAG TPA: S-adenosylmethionine decarboxylase [Candidatus Koribacter sp.]|jgi:S-adenosylmethionine decarboxylase
MHGIEWIVEAQGCHPDTLRDLATLKSLFDAIVRDLDLHPVGETRWHQFPGNGGITGLCLLSESHLAVHTFPEHQSLCLNLFCCRPRPDWDFETELATRFTAEHLTLRKITRPYATSDALIAAPSASEAGQ